VASEVSAGRYEGKDVLTDAIKKRWLTEYCHISVKEKTLKTHYVVTLCTALVVGAAFIATPATAVDISKEKTLVNDSWLTAKTKIALAADPRVNGRQIEVEGITAGLDGVKTVKNELQIVAPSTRDAVEEKDEVITVRVKEHFAKDAHLKNAAIDVQTNAGVVSLTGEVRNLMTSAQASWTARQVPSVKSVKNDLTVKEKS